MLRHAFVVLIAATALTTPAAATAAGPGTDQFAPLLQQQLDAVHAAGMPGAFAEVRDGRRTWTPTTGVIDIATGEPVRDGLRHRIGSISKTFLAVTVLQLAGEHRIGLDTPIGGYLPKLVPATVGRQVTVRMLLNHTSGIADYDTELAATAQDLVKLGRTTYRPEQLARIGLNAAPTNAPGAAFSYSNTNYVLAGLIVERVAGHSYRAEISRRVLRPLGLRDTYFEGANPLIRGPHMHAYVPWTYGKLRDFTRYNMSWAWGAGEIVSTARDVNTFFRALFTGKVLTAGLLAQMRTTVAPDPGHPDAGGYGLGVFSMRLPCGLFWGHDGGTIGHQTLTLHSPDGRRQLTYAHSMAFYQSSPTVQHPIDAAIAQFVVTALCGPQPATLAKESGAVLRTVDLARPAPRR
ncbi:D-alanyl-D-alanine carboxypeptidase [Krasilnikovia cinnamomea]|uniref:D-alanyl-D-alanine carboxypeptidase n=1 Tax=Krasilnikovia cinnamomea TaxID=349313 RepID=A0A4Q7ZSX3_9ACTN|nr:serine hydrolase domain-containing protein [Krasilnikovia cinnamomea]RZU54312.1 D-alanyl-D-alanine carboxypeptidase [Krasilnikovia cinnamomea]